MGTQKTTRGGNPRRTTSIQTVIKYAIVRAIRQIYSRYSTARKNVITAARVEIPLKNKDGSIGKRFKVFYKCAVCKKITDDIEVDHIKPVGKSPDWPFKPGELEAWITALFCSESNLQVLCVPCHKAKTANEKGAKCQI